MRLRDALLSLSLVAVPGAAAAQSCAAGSFDGQPSWKLPDDTSNGWEVRAHDYCVNVCGGEWLVRAEGGYWCRQIVGDSSSSLGGSAADKAAQAAAAAIWQRANGQSVDPTVAAGGAFWAGTALNEYLRASSARARAKKAAEEALRLEQERVRAAEEARRREEAWQRLSTQLKLASTDVSLHLDETHQELGMKFDGNDERPELKVAKKDTCAFGDCCHPYETPAQQPWILPYSEPARLRRGAVIARQTLYAPGDQRESILDQAVSVAQGCYAERSIPDANVVLPPNAVPLMQAVGVDRKLAMDEHARALATYESVKSACDLLVGTLDAARKDTSHATDLGQKKLLGTLDTMVKECTVDVAKAKAIADAAAAYETATIAEERKTFVGMALRKNEENGHPIGRCAQDQLVVDRLKAGLGPQEKAIAKAEALLASTRKEGQEHREALRRKAIDTAVERIEQVSSEYLESVERAHSFAFAGWNELATGKDSDPARLRGEDLTQLINAFRKQREEIETLKTAWGKGPTTAADAELAEKTHGLADTMALLNRKMDEAGLWSRAAGTLAKALGPEAEAAVEVATLSIEIGAEGWGAAISDRDAAIARDDLRIMREQYARTTSSIAERELALRELRSHGWCVP